MTEIFAVVVAVARRHTGYTPAEFDYSLATGWAEHDTQTAHAALHDAAYLLATEKHRTDDGTPTIPDAERREKADTLYDQIRPEVDAMTAAARAKKYVGWSTASQATLGNRIRYERQERTS